MIQDEIFHHAEMLLESGGTYATSATSALGRPSLDSWDLFTRETLQNSWDARDRTSNDDGVTFSIDYAELRGHRFETLRDFFDSRTAGLPKLAALLNDPARPNIPVLRVCDTGTSGLQGPTSAAQHTTGRNDFASFVRNIGRPSDKEMRGGTYGFGKGVFFDMSDVDTILVYTRTVDENGARSNRFIAMANSESFSQSDSLFTGRHWWGVESVGRTGNSFAEPITGIEADSLARALQMDEYFTEERPTGTTVTLLAPRTNDEAGEAIDDVLHTIANALTKWAWPHMTVRTDHQDEIDFSVTKNGVKIEIPDPNKDPVLRPFVRAYKTSIAQKEHLDASEFVSDFQREGKRKWVDITSRRPIEYLGRLATMRTGEDAIQMSSVFDAPMNHHIALMRSPRMVVTYWAGPRLGNDDSYSGVFLAAEHLDSVFAGSEPPAHDEWNPQTVNLKDPKFRNPKTDKPRTNNPVRIALNRMKELLGSSQEQVVMGESAEDVSTLTAISNDLGTIFSGATGKSTRVVSRKDSTSTNRPKSKRNGVTSSIVLDSLVSTPHGPISMFKVDVSCSPKALEENVAIKVKTAIIVDGKRKTEAEDGLTMPTSLGWIQPQSIPESWDDLASSPPGEEALTKYMRAAHWEGIFAVLQPNDTAISAEVVSLRSESEES